MMNNTQDLLSKNPNNVTEDRYVNNHFKTRLNSMKASTPGQLREQGDI